MNQVQATQPTQYYGTGRRKTSTARVFMRPGAGGMEVNGRTLDGYFPNPVLRMVVQQPLVLTETGEKFDIFVTVDASRLAKADELGIFRPVKSAALEARIPAHLRAPNWFSYSTRARVIVYNPDMVKAEQVQTYEQLADPALKGQVCTRSGSHPYNLSLGAAMIKHNGAEATENWARGIVANFARAPKGGDTDQIRAVAAGECGVAIANSYYLARLMNSDKREDQAVVAKIKAVWPNQATWGTHINVSGAGMLEHAPNKEAAVKFLEYLASDQAQEYFANGNNEWPAVPSVKVDNPALKKLGEFKADTLPIGELADTVAEAQRIFDRAGYR